MARNSLNSPSSAKAQPAYREDIGRVPNELENAVLRLIELFRQEFGADAMRFVSPTSPLEDTSTTGDWHEFAQIEAGNSNTSPTLEELSIWIKNRLRFELRFPSGIMHLSREQVLQTLQRVYPDFVHTEALLSTEPPLQNPCAAVFFSLFLILWNLFARTKEPLEE